MVPLFTSGIIRRGICILDSHLLRLPTSSRDGPLDSDRSTEPKSDPIAQHPVDMYIVVCLVI